MNNTNQGSANAAAITEAVANEIVRFPSTVEEALSVADFLLSENGCIIIGQPLTADVKYEAGMTTKWVFAVQIQRVFTVMSDATREQWEEQYGLIAARFKLTRPPRRPPIGARFYKIEPEGDME